MLDTLLDRGNAAGIVAFDHVFDQSGDRKAFLFDQFPALDDVHSDIRVDESDDVQIDGVGIGLDLEDVLLAHGIAAGIFDDRDRAVHFVQFQMMIDQHAASRVDVVQYDAVFDFSYVQHSDSSCK